MAGASNSFDGGVAGTAITPANSATSGTAFDTASNITYSSAQAHRGPLSAVVAPLAYGTVSHSLSGTGVRWARCYAKPSDFVSSVIALDLASGDRFSVDLGEGEAALVRFTPPFSFFTLDTQPFTIPGGWMRLELQATSDSGQATARLYASPEALSPTLELTGALSAPTGTWAQAVYGANNDSDTASSWIDSVAWSDTGWIGPLLDSAGPPPAVSRATVHRAATR